MSLRIAPLGSLLKEPIEKRKRRKSPAEKRSGNDPEYLDKLRNLPCCICRRAPRSQVHHLKCTGERGMSKKSSDKWGLPMCHYDHQAVERVGSKREVGWFKERGIDCLSLASALYQNRHSTEAMLAVLRAHIGREATDG